MIDLMELLINLEFIIEFLVTVKFKLWSIFRLVNQNIYYYFNFILLIKMINLDCDRLCISCDSSFDNCTGKF